MNSPLENYLAFRRSLPARPPLERTMVRARGLDFAVYRTPAVEHALPLLCINGGLIFGHELLWPALAPLARHRQLVLYDQRGRGASSTPPGIGASRIEFDGGDMPALRAALGIERWDVLGHSWGGGIAMLGAAQDQDAVRRLVLVGAVGVTSEWLPALHEHALERLQGTQRDTLAALNPAQLSRPDLDAHAAYTKAFFPAYFADHDFARAVSAPTGTSATGAVIAARLRRDGYDWRETLRDLRTPALVVHGAADVLPLAEAVRIAYTLQRAELRPLEHVGHNPFWESPAEFFALVESFLLAPSTGVGTESPPDH